MRDEICFCMKKLFSNRKPLVVDASIYEFVKMISSPEPPPEDLRHC